MARWERRLEQEKLGALDSGGMTSNRGRRGEYRNRRWAPSIAQAEATEEWLRWASEVEESFPFTSTRQRRIWSLYAAGELSLTQINTLVGGSRRSITKAIHRITLASPPPIPNPWRKSGRHLTPLRLVPREDDDMPPTAPRPLLRYSRIKLRRNDGLTLPGNPREKDVLLDMEGRPTPWGIDLVLDGGVVLSLPAWKIDHAIQAPESA